MRFHAKFRKCFLTVAAALLVVGTLPQVQGNAQEIKGPGAAIRPSANGVTIYVSKKNKTVTLKQYSNTIGTYQASIGRNSSSGDKTMEGDARTPSGSYYVCTRNDKSSYYLALGVSYPSAEDAEKGYEDGIITEEERDAIVEANRKGEQPPWDTALGGAIEIHGCRGDGPGTAGCIAVDNEVMDILWEYCKLGVPITVGP